MKKILLILGVILLLFLINFVSASKVTYSFNATYQGINVWAYDCDDSSDAPPPNSKIPVCSATLTSQTANTVLDSSDNSRLQTEDDVSDTYGWVYFNASISNINIDDITLLNWTWEGYSTESFGMASVYAYIYNFTSNSYSQFGSTTASSDIFLSTNINSTKNISNFVNSTTNVTSIIIHLSDWGTSGDAIYLYTDFVKLEITYDNLIINQPTNSKEILNSLSTTLNTSQSGYNQTIWYTWSNGIKNYTLCTNSNECQGTITFPRQGYYNLTVWGNKSDGNITSKNVNNLFVGNNTLQSNGNSYTFLNGNWQDTSNIYDDNWNTAGSTAGVDGEGNLSINYSNSSLTGKQINRFTWEVKDYNGRINLTIPSNCINSYNSSFLIFSDGGAGVNKWYCLNYSSNKYYEIRSSSGTGGQVFEEQLHYYYSSSNTNLSITNILSNNSNFSTNLVNFTFNISDDNDYISNASIYIDNILNTTFYQNYPINTSINNTLNFSISNIPDGTHSWFVRACDSDSVCTNSSTFNFTVDTTIPSLAWLFPLDDGYVGGGNTNYFNYSVSDSGIGLSACWWSNNTGISNHTITCGTNITDVEVGDGDNYNITLWANDTLNNINSIIRYFKINSVDPIVTLSYPLDNYWANYNNIIFNFSVNDTDSISQCDLYGNWSGGWHLNQTNQSGVLNNNTIFNFNSININDGYYKWNVWCNETGSGRSTWYGINRTLNIDTIYPNLILSLPQNTTYTTNQLNLNYSAIDSNRNTCYYNINNTNNITLTSCNNISFTANQGSSILRLFVNDSAGNKNSSNVSFFVDSINPSISLSTTFSNGSYLNYNTSIKINITVSDTNLNTCFYNDNLGTNTTFTCGTNLSLNLNEGLHTIQVWANDTLNNKNSANISFIVDTIYPIVLINSITTIPGSQTISFASNISDTNLNSCKYSIFDLLGNIDGLNNNVSILCNNIGTGATVSAFGTFNLTVYGMDLAGNENSTTSLFTTSAIVPSEPSGGGGSSPSTISTVALVNPNINITRTGLERAIIYTLIRSACNNETNCKLNQSAKSYILDTLHSYDIIMFQNEIDSWINSYNNNDLESVQMLQGDITKYNLFIGVLSVQLQKLILNPSRLDPFFALVLFSDTFTYEIKSNKVISNISLTGELGLTAEKNSESTILVKLNVIDKNFLAKTFLGNLEVNDIDGNTVFLPISIRTINLKNPLNWLIIGVIITFIYLMIRFGKIFISNLIKLLKSFWRKNGI